MLRSLPPSLWLFGLKAICFWPLFTPTPPYSGLKSSCLCTALGPEPGPPHLAGPLGWDAASLWLGWGRGRALPKTGVRLTGGVIFLPNVLLLQTFAYGLPFICNAFPFLVNLFSSFRLKFNFQFPEEALTSLTRSIPPFICSDNTTYILF